MAVRLLYLIMTRVLNWLVLPGSGPEAPPPGADPRRRARNSADSPYRRYQRTATAITSLGNRKPANTEYEPDDATGPVSRPPDRPMQQCPRACVAGLRRAAGGRYGAVMTAQPDSGR